VGATGAAPARGGGSGIHAGTSPGPFVLPSWCLGYAKRKTYPFYGYRFNRFYYEVFANPLSNLSKKFVLETDEAVDELFSFPVKM
jgi:hypothetical protein